LLEFAILVHEFAFRVFDAPCPVLGVGDVRRAKSCRFIGDEGVRA
jgi:hypothetical protein